MQKVYLSRDNLEPQNRLNPGWANSRFVHLKKLRKNLELLIDEYVKVKSVSKMADFGCGELPYQSLIEPYVSEFITIDLPGNPKASHYIDLNTNKTDLPDGYCDIVWSIQVLEHVEDYHKYLREANRILMEDGLIILSTHGQWEYHPDPIDYWRWTSESLKYTLKEHGFEIIEFKGLMGFLSVSLQYLQDAILISFPGKRYWNLPLCFVMQRLISLSEWFISKSKTLTTHKDLDSDIFMVVARKPKAISPYGDRI